MPQLERPRTPTEKGMLICDTLKKFGQNFRQLKIVKSAIPGEQIDLMDEFGNPGKWDYFVQFPKELVELFPGSYISPDMFLNGLGQSGQEKERQDITKKILGSQLGEAEAPIYSFEKGNFHLNVMNGLSNPYATVMSKLAAEASKVDPKDGFAKHPDAAYIRATYQTAMIANIEKALKKPEHVALYIHDDCLATGDSIISYIESIRQQDPEQFNKIHEKGMQILIDGPATAQGILYLQAYADANDIKLELTVGNMAFGLSPGEENEQGNLRHANYITYPQEQEFLSQLDQKFKEKILKLKASDGQIYVVGDMGEAEKGISEEELRKCSGRLIKEWGRRTAGILFLINNSLRQDTHGDHPNNKGFTVKERKGEGVIQCVYFARGGFLPFTFNDLAWAEQDRDNLNINILRVSRLNVVDRDENGDRLGYGAAIRNAEGVTVVQ